MQRIGLRYSNEFRNKFVGGHRPLAGTEEDFVLHTG
jgi:hypothetical protein